MRRSGRGWDLSFFLAVRKRHPQHLLLLEESCTAGATPALSTHQSPSLLAAFPAAFFMPSLRCCR